MTVSTTGRGALRAAGWRPGRDTGDDALRGMLVAVGTAAPNGDRPWEPFPAAERALREFHGLTVPPAAAGAEVAATGSTVNPAEARFAPRIATSFGKAIGQRLFPFGRTDADALLFIDEKGRLFAVDHGGWWLLGASAEEGLTALAEGRAPRRIAPRTQHWQLPRHPDEDAVTDLVKTAMVPVYVLHHHGLLTARSVRFRVVGLRGHGSVRLDDEFPLAPGSLDAGAARLIDDIRRALGPTPLVSAEASVELCPVATGVTCSISSGRQGDQGIGIRLTADTRIVLESEDKLAAAAAEFSSYESRRAALPSPLAEGLR
ncbi:SUKH-3 domain-containing protein [Streptomyces caatingaensis]|uniref:SUKH-3 domain-containing protein n=1 Tax=Streptomyces caatingaensis TaxID=1678637 RepID=UPI00069DC422|nr:SUKH-3 domain-containing protein [Streptomyces caatingaensis]